MLPGREDEVARIDRLLDGARSGVSAALIIHGDPGIGKTALLDAVAASATGFLLLRAAPLEAESGLPFAGLSDLLRPLLPLLDRIAEPQAAVLSGALALGPPTPGDRFAAAAATISLFAAGAKIGPVLAVIDDAHWLDTPSREALLFAGRRLGRERIVLLMAMRERPWLLANGIARLKLRRLDTTMARGLVSGAARPVSTLVRERLVADACGTPLARFEAALTSQELQVALVIADGATNKEAGAALFISPKTIEFHLGHIYGKLGVRSRSELVRMVATLSMTEPFLGAVDRLLR